MKSQTVAVSVLGAVGTVVAGNYVAMDVETWCLTYISTYLVPVSVPGGSLLPTTRRLDSPATEGSLKPTSGGGTSTQATTGTDIPDASTSLIVLESSQTSILSSIGSGSSAVAFETTISTLTDELTISLDPTTSTDINPTSTSGVDEPAGRIVIFQIVVPDNEKRDLNRELPMVLSVTITQGQLFDSGVPIFYSGEDFKELSGQGSPTADAITTAFADSGQRLVFRNSGLPNGEARFCQNSNGLIYTVFTTGPSSCVPVNLAVYGVEQCQNGRLVGVDELTSTTGITNSETASPETTSSATNTESVVNPQSTRTTQATAPTETSSESLGKSTTTAHTQSVESSSDTASPETSTTLSSRAIDSSTSLSSVVTTQTAPETSVTDVSALPDTEDDTTTEGESVSSSITTEPVSETSTTEVSTSSEESSSTESTESSSPTSTSIEPLDSTTESSSPETSETTSEVLADTATSAAPENTETGTTANAPAPDETTSTEIAGIEDTTTTNAEIPTTTQPDTTAQDTTTAVEVPTTEPTEAGTTAIAPAPGETTSEAP